MTTETQIALLVLTELLTAIRTRDAQEALADVQNAITEQRNAQDDLRTIINSTMKRWNEQAQQIKTTNIEKYAVEAAEKAVAKMTEEKLVEPVERRIRAVQSNA